MLMWESLKSGKFFSGEFSIRAKGGKELWMIGTFNPMIIDGVQPEKIMMFAQFTTQEKEKLNELNAMVSALKSTLPVLEFTESFQCKTANEKSLLLFGISRLQLKQVSISTLLDAQYAEAWGKAQGDIIAEGNRYMALPLIVKGVTRCYEVSFNVIRGLDGRVLKVVMVIVKEVNKLEPMLAAV